MILGMVWKSLWETFNTILGPASGLARSATLAAFAAPAVKADPATAQKLAIENFNQLFKQLSDPDNDPVTAIALRFIMLLGTVPFTLGSAASIVAQKNLLIPLTEAMRPALLDAPENIEALFRKILDDKSVKAGLAKLGYEDSDIKVLLELAQFVPGAQDIIHFAVREVYNPKTVAAFGQLEGFDDIWKLAEKDATAAKLPKETLSKYWAAHWELPGINQAYEMLHRGFITEDDLSKLFVAADVMPFWRDKLKSISYSTLTRVDVRRMHKLGVLDLAGVKKSYRDIGYDETNAQLLTDFTVAYNADPENAEETDGDRKRKAQKDLTKAEILNAYADRLLSQQDTATELYYLGYSEEETAQLLAMQDYKLAVADVKKSLGYYRDGFLTGAYTEAQVQAQLGKLGLPATYTSNALDQWKLEKSARVETPTKAEYLSFWKAGTIAAAECAAGLAALGYSQKHITWYMTPVKKAGG